MGREGGEKQEGKRRDKIMAKGKNRKEKKTYEQSREHWHFHERGGHLANGTLN